MFFEPGFLGTKALMYMDIVTLYFAILPFLLGFSIYQAIRGNAKLHYQSQFLILAVTIIMVLIFEIGVRLTGGFLEYSKQSPLSYDFLLIFLVIHILIALMAVGGWIYLIISTYKSYQNGSIENSTKHRKIGKWIFGALTITSLMGCSIYLFLFV
jgi:putative membrane protein